MKRIDLELCGGAIVKGCLYRTKDPVYLREDLLEIDLPSGLTIDVGWYPEGNPEGAYRIVVFQGYWANQVIEPITTPDIEKAVQIIERLCSMFAAPRLSSSSCSRSGFMSISSGAPQYRAVRFEQVIHNKIVFSFSSTSNQLSPREYALS